MKDVKVFNTIYAVDEYKVFDEYIRNVSTSFNKFNKRVSSGFVQVAALGKTKNYSRREILESFFRGD